MTIPNGNAAKLRRRLGAAGALVAAAGLVATGGAGAAVISARPANRAIAHKTNTRVSGAITFSWWGDPVRNAHTYGVIKLFEKSYPKVQVTGTEEAFNQYWQKLTAEAAAGTLPCVTQTQSRELTSYTPNNVFMNLNPLIKSGAINVSAMPKAIVDTGKVNGKLYMIPYGAAYMGLMYNNTILRKLKLPPPAAGSNWADLGNWLSQLRKKLPSDMYPIDGNGQLADAFISYAEGYGKSLFDKQGQLGFSASFLKTYWGMWLKWQNEKIALPETLAAQEGSTIEQSYLVQKKVVVEGEPGNQIQDAQIAATQDHVGNLSVMIYPYGPAGMGNILVTSGLSIPTRGCSNVSAAAAFINFFTNNPAGAKVFASNNGAVTDTALLNQQIKSPGTAKSVKQYLRVFEYISAHHAPLVTYPPGYTIVFQTLFPQVFQKIAAGQESLTAGVASFMSQAKADLSA